MDNFSYLAVVVGGLAFFFLGAIWYSFLFQKPWTADMGIDMSGGTGKPPPSAVGTLVVAFIVAYIVEFLFATATSVWPVPGCTDGHRDGSGRGTERVLRSAAESADVDQRRIPAVGGVIVGAIAAVL